MPPENRIQITINNYFLVLYVRKKVVLKCLCNITIWAVFIPSHSEFLKLKQSLHFDVHLLNTHREIYGNAIMSGSQD